MDCFDDFRVRRVARAFQFQPQFATDDGRALGEDDNAVCQLCGLFDVVRDENDCARSLSEHPCQLATHAQARQIV